MKWALSVSGIALVLLIVFFRVDFDFQFSMPQEIQVPDSGQELKYTDCVDARDVDIHRTAFATIDNPDVQREYLSTHKDIAKEECRAEFPEMLVTEKRPLHIRLFELEYRFSD